jgi:hypothetical protein
MFPSASLEKHELVLEEPSVSANLDIVSAKRYTLLVPLFHFGVNAKALSSPEKKSVIIKIMIATIA